MLLGGLWHGAAWTFVLWGAFHGIWLGVHRAVSGRDWWRTAPRASVAERGTHEQVRAPRSPLWLRRTVTFHLVAVAWVLFRAGSLADVAVFFSRLFAAHPLLGPLPLGPIALVLIGAVTHGLAVRFELNTFWRSVPRPVQGAVYGVIIVLIGLFSAQSGRFIYFQF